MYVVDEHENNNKFKISSSKKIVKILYQYFEV